MFEEKAMEAEANSKDKSALDQEAATMMLQKARRVNASIFKF